ncbi:MAG: FdrA protein [Micromonosporaceae bacterium]|jgi:FdrA protein|nr:FdrA protein [Micromonosporaceae bacterium]
MQISSALTKRPGISSALVAMATGLNLELLTGMGFDPPARAAPQDMLVALIATDDSAMAQALDALETELAGTGAGAGAGSDGTGGQVPPRTTFSAARGLVGPAVALVSTPGRYAFVEAMDALDAGASVMIFSDNVPVAQEIRLKETAIQRGLLVMGPDCGTAVIGGVGLGFANVVRPGPVGLVAASGTGAQQVMSLLATAGVGISHCLGVGGRDLSTAIAGRSTHAALDALDADPATELIIVMGKPPAADVADAVRAHAQRLRTPVLVAPLGPGQPDLTAVVEDILAHLDVAVPEWSWWEPRSPAASSHGAIRGLFSGGTLCVEALVIASAALGPVRSNVPLSPEWTLDARPAGGHTMVDLGADEYTVGRPHPMLDFGPRLSLLATEAADPHCRVILLDVVLGHGAHPDPGAELAPAVRSALARRPGELTVVVSLVGTPEDPQEPRRQASELRDAGAWVFASNAAAARHAVRIARGESPQ